MIPNTNLVISARHVSWIRCIFLSACASAAFAHDDHPEAVVTVYAVDPANPQVSYDEDPSVKPPGVPEDPGVVYPSGGAPVPSTPPGPGVITNDTPPDTHTPNRSDWNRYVSYALPSESARCAAAPTRRPECR